MEVFAHKVNMCGVEWDSCYLWLWPVGQRWLLLHSCSIQVTTVPVRLYYLTYPSQSVLDDLSIYIQSLNNDVTYIILSRLYVCSFNFNYCLVETYTILLKPTSCSYKKYSRLKTWSKRWSSAGYSGYGSQPCSGSQLAVSWHYELLDIRTDKP